MQFSISTSGLKFRDYEVGLSNYILPTDEVQVMYKLYLKDGHKHIYSQATPAEAYSFVIGAGQVITGFDEAVRGMRVGGKRVAILKPDIAYGNTHSTSHSLTLYVLGEK